MCYEFISLRIRTGILNVNVIFHIERIFAWITKKNITFLQFSSTLVLLWYSKQLEVLYKQSNVFFHRGRDAPSHFLSLTLSYRPFLYNFFFFFLFFNENRVYISKIQFIYALFGKRPVWIVNINTNQCFLSFLMIST